MATQRVSSASPYESAVRFCRALRIGDRIAILRDGELIQVGSPDEIVSQPANDYVEAFVSDVTRHRQV